jgi:hypothetical protein
MTTDYVIAITEEVKRVNRQAGRRESTVHTPTSSLYLFKK